MGKIYQGNNLFADTSTLGGGGSVTPAVLVVDAMSKEFIISASGSKTFYITNMLGAGEFIEADGTYNPYSTRVQISNGGNSLDQTFYNNFTSSQAYIEPSIDASKFIATCPCTITITTIPLVTSPGNYITGTVISRISYV